MTKLRKQRKRKVYRANVNRKRLRNKLNNTGPVICDEIKKDWEPKISAKQNLEQMGLMYDPNKSLKVPNNKQELLAKITASGQWTVESSDGVDVAPAPEPSKKHVAEALQKEASAPRRRLFRLPNSQVTWITYLMDTYGTDYKAMARDKRNHYQHTWRQIRAQINKFIGVPEQFNKYLEERTCTD